MVQCTTVPGTSKGENGTGTERSLHRADRLVALAYNARNIVL